jgi:hypothetical protein
MSCGAPICDRPVLARQLCSMHYQRMRANGQLGGPDPKPRHGPGNPNWKGGRIRGGHESRYWMRFVSDHPAANPLGYVLEHRLVMEEQLGRPLATDEIVHHINHDPTDNRPENLEAMTQGEHAARHARERAHA